MHADHHVLENGHPGKKLRRLKCSSNTRNCDLIRPQAYQFAAIKGDTPFRYGKKATNGIEQRCLTRAVRADNSYNLAWRKSDGHVAERVHAAKIHGQVANAKIGSHGRELAFATRAESSSSAPCSFSRQLG